MNTTNENIAKLQDNSNKRGEAWIELSRCLSVHEHNLPQELITAWGEFELLEREARTIEVEAIKGIEREIEVLQKKQAEQKKILGFSDRVFVVLVILIIAGHVTMDLIVPHFFVIGEPAPLKIQECYSLIRC